LLQGLCYVTLDEHVSESLNRIYTALSLPTEKTSECRPDNRIWKNPRFSELSWKGEITTQASRHQTIWRFMFTIFVLPFVFFIIGKLIRKEVGIPFLVLFLFHYYGTVRFYCGIREESQGGLEDCLGLLSTGSGFEDSCSILLLGRILFILDQRKPSEHSEVRHKTNYSDPIKQLRSLTNFDEK